MKKIAKRTPKVDWRRAEAMTAKQRRVAAQADDNNRPMTDQEWAGAPRVPRVSTIRRALKLSREDAPTLSTSRSARSAIGSRAGRSQTLRPGIRTLSHGSRRRCAKHLSAGGPPDRR
jgi:hypothetical protein